HLRDRLVRPGLGYPTVATTERPHHVVGRWLGLRPTSLDRRTRTVQTNLLFGPGSAKRPVNMVHCTARITVLIRAWQESWTAAVSNMPPSPTRDAPVVVGRDGAGQKHGDTRHLRRGSRPINRRSRAAPGIAVFLRVHKRSR